MPSVQQQAPPTMLGPPFNQVNFPGLPAPPATGPQVTALPGSRNVDFEYVIDFVSIKLNNDF